MSITGPAISSERESLLVLHTDEIDRLPWQRLPDCPGVDYKTLWRNGDFAHNLLRYQPGARTPGHPHMAAYHHIWVVSGSASIAGRHVSAGSYLMIPPGTAHTVSNVGTGGCVLLQVYRPMRRLGRSGESTT